MWLAILPAPAVAEQHAEHCSDAIFFKLPKTLQENGETHFRPRRTVGARYRILGFGDDTQTLFAEKLALASEIIGVSPPSAALQDAETDLIIFHTGTDADDQTKIVRNLLATRNVQQAEIDIIIEGAANAQLMYFRILTFKDSTVRFSVVAINEAQFQTNPEGFAEMAAVFAQGALGFANQLKRLKGSDGIFHVNGEGFSFLKLHYRSLDETC